jgi:hypothetical protein
VVVRGPYTWFVRYPTPCIMKASCLRDAKETQLRPGPSYLIPRDGYIQVRSLGSAGGLILPNVLNEQIVRKGHAGNSVETSGG